MAGIVAAMSYPRCQVGYFRRTYPELDGPGGAIFRSQQILSGTGAKWQSTQHRWTLPTGSILQFCHCQNEDDVFRYQSQQFDVMLFDEATHFTEAQLTYLLTRNRLTIQLPAPIAACASNPGNVGHAWFQRIFRPGDDSETIRTVHLEGGAEPLSTFFLPARLDDNPALEGRDPLYRKTLEALPEHLRKQLLEGSWDSFAGQAFPEWNPEVHVVKPFAIPPYWKRWRANDPGYTDPGPWYWMAADEAGEHIYVYREYSRGPTDPRLTYSEQAAQVAALSLVGTEVPGSPPAMIEDENGLMHAHKEKIDYTVTGMDAFIAHPETGKSITTFYAEGGVHDCIKPVYGSGARKQMAATYREYLKPYTGPDGRLTAKLQVFSTCRRLIETLPQLIVDDKRPEQVAEMAIDHWYQACGYGAQSHHARHSEPPKPYYAPTNEQRVHRHKQKLAKELKRRARWAG